MTDIARHPTPAFGAVLVEQVRAVGLAVRREALVLAVVLGLIGLLILADAWSAGEPVTGQPIPPMLMIVLGALAPFAVWKGDRAFEGAHLWTLPVERRRHALTKVLAGAMWLLAAVAGFQLWQLALALASGGSLAEPETRMLVGPGGVSDLTPVRWTPRPWEWASTFTTALTCYLIGSAFMLGVKYPLRWGTAAVAAFIALAALAESEVTGGLAKPLFEAVTMGPLGIDAATTGGGDAEETRRLTGGRDFIGPEVLVLWTRLPSFEQWAPAALFWAALGALAVWIAASRHRER